MHFFKNKIVRDLEFVIKSPPLIGGNNCLPDANFGLSQTDIFNFLQSTDNDPSELISFVASKNTVRLGKYLEVLLHYYLNCNPRVDVVDASVQIFDGKITIGEADFILFDKSRNEFVHLEFAVKFFIRWEGQCDYSKYICPDGKRNLAAKLEANFDRQLKLFQSKQGVQYLESKNINIARSLCYIKGFIFYFNNDQNNHCPESLLAPDHNFLSAYRFSSDFDLRSTAYYRVAKKEEWVSLNEDILSNLLSASEMLKFLTNHFNSSTSGLILSEYRVMTQQKLIEQTKFAVLHPLWPTM